MKALSEVLRLGKVPRVLGIDDAPSERRKGAPVGLCGVVCAGVRMEGMLWGETERDGEGAGEVIGEMVRGSKFWPQLHAVLLDGIAVGGWNVVDLEALAARVERPCVAVMRRHPDLEAVHRSLLLLEHGERRLEVLGRAGEIHEVGGFVFQVCGGGVEEVAGLLARVTDQGQVPEALRLAHMIGSAVMMGESGRRA